MALQNIIPLRTVVNSSTPTRIKFIKFKSKTFRITYRTVDRGELLLEVLSKDKWKVIANKYDIGYVEVSYSNFGEVPKYKEDAELFFEEMEKHLRLIY